jgi:hypothetical protein
MNDMEESWIDKIARKVRTRQSSRTLRRWAHELVLASNAADPPCNGHGLSFWGYLTLKVFKNGKLIDIIEGKNTIITAGKIFALQLLGNVSGAQSIVKMAIGDGGCGGPPDPWPTPSQLSSPIPFVVTDTTLRHQLSFTNDPVGYRYITPGPVVNEPGQFITFVATFNSSQINPTSFGFAPNVVNEAALVSGNDKILALRAFKSQPFDQGSAIELRAEWAIGCA